MRDWLDVLMDTALSFIHQKINSEFSLAFGTFTTQRLFGILKVYVPKAPLVRRQLGTASQGKVVPETKQTNY